MTTIQIGLSRRTNFNILSAIIMGCQGTNFSHAYIKLPIPSNPQRSIVFQASGLAVNFMAIETFNAAETVVNEYSFSMDDPTYNKIVNFAFDSLGKPYSLMELVGFGWIMIGQMIGQTWKNPFGNSGTSYVCSVLAAAILVMIGDTLSEDLDSISPKDLKPLLEKYSDKQV